jgi:malonyl CoA-acyl carrier protein transacylase
MEDSTEIDVREIQRLRLEPGDVLIYRTSVKLTVEQVDHIKEQLRAIFDSDIPIVVLSHDARLQVVNKNELDQSVTDGTSEQIARAMREAKENPGRVVGLPE